MDYQELDTLLGKRQSKKLANNTYAKRCDGMIAVTYHSTDIVRFFPNGTIVMHSGGYRTKSTRERLNRYLPQGFRVEQKAFIWYLHTPQGMSLFHDGSSIDTASEVCPSPDTTGEEAAQKLLLTWIDEYVEGYTLEVLSDLVLEASTEGIGGECWYCVGNLGPHVGDDHLLTHIQEQYCMWSLLCNVYTEDGVSNPAQLLHNQIRIRYIDGIHRRLKAYLARHLLPQASRLLKDHDSAVYESLCEVQA